MSIFSSIFGTAPTQQLPTQPAPGNNPTQVANPGNGLPSTHQSQTTPPNGVIPTEGVQPPNVTEPPGNQSPLDPFKDIWQTVTPNKDDPNSGPIFTAPDPQKIMDAAKKVDFSKVVTPETLAQIAQGGEKAATAFLTAINQVSQLTYAQSAMATSKIVEQALDKQQQRYEANLPGQLKKLSAGDTLASNPLINHPAVAPLAGALTEQLQRKNPNATASEIAEQVGQYFNQMATAFTPQKPAAKVPASEDWGKFFDA